MNRMAFIDFSLLDIHFLAFPTAQEQLEWDNYCEARMREMRAHYRKLRRVLAKLDMKLSALTGGEQSAADSSIVTQGEDGPGTSFSSPGASSAQSAESNNSSPGDNEDYVDPAATSVAASPSSGRPARRKAAAAAPSVYAEALAAAEDASLTESELDEVSGTRTTKRQRRSVVRL